MRTILHILTVPPDELLQTLLRQQQGQADLKVQIIDLTGPGEPDYSKVLDLILVSDSVSTW